MYYPASFTFLNASQPWERNIRQRALPFCLHCSGMKILQWSNALRKKTKIITLSWNTLPHQDYFSLQSHSILCPPYPRLLFYQPSGIPPYTPCSCSHRAFACAFALPEMLFSIVFAQLSITYSQIIAKLSTLTRSVHESLLHSSYYSSNFALICIIICFKVIPPLDSKLHKDKDHNCFCYLDHKELVLYSYLLN